MPDLKKTNNTFYAHPTAIIDEGCEIGEGVKIWHFSHVMHGSKIGAKSNLGQNVVVSPDVVIGEGVRVQNNTSIYTGVTLEDYVFIGSGVVFTNISVPRAFFNQKDAFVPTLVKRGATIGSNATIICGVTIGEYAFIGAGSVVTRDVKPYSLVVGNPARHKYFVNKEGKRDDLFVFD